jgi:dolichyl-phosphate beta-glucosyltransferase
MVPPSPTGPRSLTVVLPAFNEADRIGPALDELFEYLRTQAGNELPPQVDVVVVDDGSRDGTDRIVAARPEAQSSAGGSGPAPVGAAAPPAEAAPAATLRLLRERHGGKGAAVRAGMLAAQGDLMIFADADMATPPNQLPKLVAALADADVALGSRIQPDGSDMRASQPQYRRFLGRVFHNFASLWVVGPVEDTQCGFKGFTREAAEDLFSRQVVTSIVFDVELVYLARRRGYTIAIVPIEWEDRRGSRMQPGPGLALRVAWDLVRIPLLHRDVRRQR